MRTSGQGNCPNESQIPGRKSPGAHFVFGPERFWDLIAPNKGIFFGKASENPDVALHWRTFLQALIEYT